MNATLLRVSRWVIDLLILSLAFGAASVVRFDGDIPYVYLKRVGFSWPYIVGLEYLVLAAFNVPRFSWRYVGLPEAGKILKACLVSTGIVVLVRIITEAIYPQVPHAQFLMLPYGVIAGNFAFSALGILGVRVLRRVLAENNASGRRDSQQRAIPTMLVGAGEGGVAVAKELRSRPNLGLTAVGFLDDDPLKVGMVVHGIRVLGTTAQLAELCHRHGAQQVLVTIAAVSGGDVRRIVDACEAAGLPAKIIPALHDIVGGKINLSRIRNVAIEDLLGREPVQLEMEGIANLLQGKTVLVTGAGGSIGSEICRQVARFSPARLVLVERFESALFEIHSELHDEEQTGELWPQIADITDRQRMELLLQKAGPVDVIFHAAAHKHVPLMEQNPQEAIKNNVVGTKILADLAAAYQVKHFVMISTDKAVNPTSVMGASKRVAELYVQGMHSQVPQTKYVSVRFGNVLGSNGSVIPIFRRQIERGGPITVTHPEMTRYFMTIPEASQLVLQAAALGKGGEVFILDMGKPVKIVDLACDLIRLSGLEPGKDIEITYSGIRPGEKLFEELATDAERAEKTRHQKIFIGRVQAAAWCTLLAGVEALAERAKGDDPRGIYEGLRALIPEFSGESPGGEPAKVIPLRRS